MRLSFSGCCAVLVGCLLSAGTASAFSYSVDFETNLPGFTSDPDGVLPAGWNHVSGFEPVGATAFTGSWEFDDSATDTNPTAGEGLFSFSDPGLTIQLDAGGLSYEFQLDTIETSYDDSFVNFFVIEGSSTTPTVAGMDSEKIEIFWATMNPIASIPSPDSPYPLPFVWEDGSGLSSLTVSGSGGGKSYQWGKVLGTYGDVTSTAVPEPTAALVFATGWLVVAWRRRARR